MKRILCPNLPVPGRPVELPEAEARHATLVLRLRDGDEVEAIDGKGNATVGILRVRGGPIRLESTGAAPIIRGADRHETVPLSLELSVLKGDAMEWVVEKAVELGVRRLVPTLTSHTVVQIDRKGPEFFQQRWQKIADQALKQCGRLERMEILPPLDFEAVLLRSPHSAKKPRIWCDEAVAKDGEFLLERLRKLEGIEEVSLLIGPEGGWSQTERERLLNPSTGAGERVSLGPLTLRAETAALFAISLAVARFRFN